MAWIRPFQFLMTCFRGVPGGGITYWLLGILCSLSSKWLPTATIIHTPKAITGCECHVLSAKTLKLRTLILQTNLVSSYKCFCKFYISNKVYTLHNDEVSRYGFQVSPFVLRNASPRAGFCRYFNWQAWNHKASLVFFVHAGGKVKEVEVQDIMLHDTTIPGPSFLQIFELLLHPKQL